MSNTSNTDNTTTILRQPAEIKYQEDLAYLASVDTAHKPFSWHLSPNH